MWIRNAAACTVALAALAFTGCDNNGEISGPDTAPPLAPHVSHAYAKDAGRVILTWIPNSESDLLGYNVYQLGPNTRINSIPVQDTRFSTNAGSDQVVFYRVTAVDRSGNESAPSATVEVLIGSGNPTLEPTDLENSRHK